MVRRNRRDQRELVFWCLWVFVGIAIRMILFGGGVSLFSFDIDFLFFLLVLLALVVTELHGKSKSQLGKLLHVIKVDVRNIIVGGVDVRAAV